VVAPPTVHLLDVNVLIALAWPTHVHHQAAHAWFTGPGSGPFATCPITQCGFVRVSSTPKIIAGAVTPAEALASLDRIVANPRHVFWPADLALGGATVMPRERITGHRQVTDAYLLGLCLARGERLATFDQGVRSLARSNAERDVIIIIPT
jgi:toxin-antitoxin system PIN domain toxin